MNDIWHEFWQNDHTPWDSKCADEELQTLYSTDIAPLLKNFKELNTLVPLCGHSKAIDLLRAKGHLVTGVELIPKAIEELIKLHPQWGKAEILHTDDESRYKFESIEIICKDFLEYNQQNKHEFVYDRAAFVAIAPECRKEYADTVTNCLTKNGVLFLISFSTGLENPPGPPYSVEYDDIMNYFSQLSLLQHKSVSAIPSAPKYMEIGVKTLEKHLFIFQKK